MVFDFFGTLTVAVPAADRHAGAARLAAALGVPAGPFDDALTGSFYERATGQWGDMAATLRRLAAACGVEPTAAQLAEACRVRMANEAGFVRLRPEAPAVVAALAGAGLRLGLISDCTHELPELWPGLELSRWFGAATFSVVAGRHKPDPLLYTGTAAALGVAPDRCLYVGDGGSDELTGAVAAGMAAVHLAAPDADGALVYRRDTAWAGPRVASLLDVARLAGVAVDR